MPRPPKARAPDAAEPAAGRPARPAGRSRAGAAAGRAEPQSVTLGGDDGQPRGVGALWVHGIDKLWRVPLLLPRSFEDLSRPQVAFAGLVADTPVCVGGVAREMVELPPCAGAREPHAGAGGAGVEPPERRADEPEAATEAEPSAEADAAGTRWKVRLADIGAPAMVLEVVVRARTDVERALLADAQAGAPLWLTGVARFRPPRALLVGARPVCGSDVGQVLAHYPSRTALQAPAPRARRAGGGGGEEAAVRAKLSAAATRELVRAKLPYSVGRACTELRSRLELDGGPHEWELLAAAESPAPTLEALLRTVHDPRDAAHGAAAVQALERLAALDLLRQVARDRANAAPKTHALTIDCAALGDGVRLMQAAIGGPITTQQRLAVAEICDDLRSPARTHRILCGDVGTGKTIVFGIVGYALARVGELVVIIEPRTLLARQIHARLSACFADVPVRLVTSDSDSTLEFAHGIVVGTTAIWSRVRDLARPAALIIADEQHKLGVEQRQPWAHAEVNLLECTATAIPRTQALIEYSGVHLTGLYAGHIDKSVTTVVGRGHAAALAAYDVAARRVVREGANLIVVYPCIDVPSNWRPYVDLEADVDARGDLADEAARAPDARERAIDASVAQGLELWRSLLPPESVDFAHGRRADSERVLERFAAGEIKVLLTTTLIEIGIDLPRADQMIIHSPERMGVAATHQLRGRQARRGGHAWCYLVCSHAVQRETYEIMQLMTTVSDGLVLAEADLRRRGGGDLGRQSRLQSGDLRGLLVGRSVSYGDLDWATTDGVPWLGEQARQLLVTAPPAPDIVAALQPLAPRRAPPRSTPAPAPAAALEHRSEPAAARRSSSAPASAAQHDLFCEIEVDEQPSAVPGG